MPTPKPITSKAGTTTYKVRFRHGATNGSQTFISKRRATWFCEQIEEHGTRFALRALEQLEEDLHGENPDDHSPTLKVVANQFFEWIAPRLSSELSLDQKKRRFEHHIEPTLGHLPIATITTADVESWLDLLISGKITNRRTRKPRPLGAKTIRELHSLLSQIMNWAAHPHRAYIAANPCSGHSSLPKKKQPVPKGMMPMQWQTLRATMLQLGYSDAADLGDFLIGSGWRIGEAVALPVANVEDYGPNAPMYVTMNQVTRREKNGSRIVEAEGKTERAMRRIQLDPETAAVVRRNCIGKRHKDLVFLWKGERPWQVHNFRDRLEKACEKAELPHITPHWFRHTHVAWLAMSGAPLPELQRRIGHANIQTTIGVYGSMIGDVKTDTLSAFTAMRDSAPVVEPKAAPQTIESTTA